MRRVGFGEKASARPGVERRRRASSGAAAWITGAVIGLGWGALVGLGWIDLSDLSPKLSAAGQEAWFQLELFLRDLIGGRIPPDALVIIGIVLAVAVFIIRALIRILLNSADGGGRTPSAAPDNGGVTRSSRTRTITAAAPAAQRSESHRSGAGSRRPTEPRQSPWRRS